MRRLFGLFLKIPALRKLLKAPLKTKVNVYYITVLIPAFLALFFATTSIDAVFIRRQMMVSSQQTLEAVDKNYSYILQNVYQFSDYLYFDEEVQNALRSTKQSGINPSIQEIINKSLINMIISSSDIASAYLLDNYGNCYSMSKLNDESVDYKHLTSAPWYEKKSLPPKENQYGYSTTAIPFKWQMVRVRFRLPVLSAMLTPTNRSDFCLLI